jgi:nucleoside-diphosphate-sugar epimerase
MDPRVVRTALDGCDGLLHAAAVYSYDRKDIARMSADTPALAASVLGAALDARLTRVVDVASAVIYTTVGDIVTTTTRLVAAGDPTDRDRYVRAKVAAENTATELEGRGLPRVTLHPSRVIGPEDAGPGTSGASVIAVLKGGLTTDARGGWIDVRDVAAAAVAAFEAPVGTHVVLSAGNERYRELANLLDTLTGRKPRRTFLPFRALRVMARLNDVAGGRLADLPTADALEYVLTSPPIDGSSGQALIGHAYRSLDEMLTDAIRWWAANGVLDAKVAGRLAA